jgi:C4-dicarboxylate-specific signal transduction histidine kinase
VYEEHLEGYRQLTEDVFKGRKGMLQFQTVSETGERRWMETHAAPLRDRNGEIVALLGITRDIHDRKMAEERIRQHQLDLEHVCRVSTLGEMSSTLAHELNQPLCAISSYAQACVHLLQTNSMQAKILSDTLDKVVSEAERASSIIARLREWVRKKAPDRRSVTVDRLIHEVTETIRPELDVNAVSLKNEIDSHLPSVYVDPIQIEQVIINLERNALEAMRGTRNGRELIVRASTRNSDMIEIAVCDNGPGVPETLTDRIFDSYFTTKRDGMGLGLSIARTIIESHGGAICYRTRESGGAVFRLTLPVRSASVAEST